MYNGYMIVRKRKKRSDRMHILYKLECIETGDFYIGLSAIIGAARKKTLNERFRRHLSKATHEGKSWKLHKLLRKYPDTDMWEKTILGEVRGRKPAHQLERKLIGAESPTLNTF